MAKLIYDDVSVTFGAVDLSDHCTRAIVTRKKITADSTGFGDDVTQTAKGTRETITAELVFQQDYASAKVNATLKTAYESSSTTTVVLKPTSAAVGSANPSMTLTAVVAEYSPIDATDAQLGTLTVPLMVNAYVEAAS